MFDISYDSVATEAVVCGCGTHVAILFLAVYAVATVLWNCGTCAVELAGEPNLIL